MKFFNISRVRSLLFCKTIYSKNEYYISSVLVASNLSFILLVQSLITLVADLGENRFQIFNDYDKLLNNRLHA